MAEREHWLAWAFLATVISGTLAVMLPALPPEAISTLSAPWLTAAPAQGPAPGPTDPTPKPGDPKPGPGPTDPTRPTPPQPSPLPPSPKPPTERHISQSRPLSDEIVAVFFAR